MLSKKCLYASLLAVLAAAVLLTSCSSGDDAVVPVRKNATPLYLALYDGQGNDLLADTAAVSVYSVNMDEPLPVVFKEYGGRRYLYVVPVMNGVYQQDAVPAGKAPAEGYISTRITAGGRTITVRTYLHQTDHGAVDSLKESRMASQGYQLYGSHITTPEKAWVADMMVTDDGAFLCTPSLLPEYLGINIDFYSPAGTNILDSLAALHGRSMDGQWLQSLYDVSIRPHNSMPAMESTRGWSATDSRLALCASMGDWTYHPLHGCWQGSGYTFELQSPVLFGDGLVHTVELTFARTPLGNKITGCAFDGTAFDVDAVVFRESLFYGVNLEYYQR